MRRLGCLCCFSQLPTPKQVVGAPQSPSPTALLPHSWWNQAASQWSTLQAHKQLRTLQDHLWQPPGAPLTCGGWQQRGVDGDEITQRPDLFQRQLLNSKSSRFLGSDDGVVAYGLKAKAERDRELFKVAEIPHPISTPPAWKRGTGPLEKATDQGRRMCLLQTTSGPPL